MARFGDGREAEGRVCIWYVVDLRPVSGEVRQGFVMGDRVVRCSDCYFSRDDAYREWLSRQRWGLRTLTEASEARQRLFGTRGTTYQIVQEWAAARGPVSEGAVEI